MRIAWFSPLPPMPSGIADYSFELLPFVAEHAEVVAVCPADASSGGVRAPQGIEVLDPGAVLTAEADGPRFDAVFYHLGNNPFHEFVYRAALARPGVAVLHEFVLHHLLDHLLFGGGRYEMDTYRRLLAEECGPDGTRLARLRAMGVFTEFERFLFPLSGHVARASLAAVVHAGSARDYVIEVAPGVTVTVIPHHAGRPPAEVQGLTREEARERLGLPAGAFVVGQLGFITRPKQPAAVLGGFARLLERRPDALLLVVGENQVGVGVEQMIDMHGLRDRVRVMGYVDPVRFALAVKAVDAVVNLRYPSAGEASGTFTRALAEGRPAIATNLGSFAEFPDRVCLKVEADEDQARQVGDHLIRLASDPGFAASLGQRAREFARTTLDPRACARMYADVARLVGARVKASA